MGGGGGRGKYLKVTVDMFVKENVGMVVDNFLDVLDSNIIVEVVNRILNETVDRDLLEATMYKAIDKDIALTVAVDGGLHVVDIPKIGDEFSSVIRLCEDLSCFWN